jgi:hypothetical protein
LGTLLRFRLTRRTPPMSDCLSLRSQKTYARRGCSRAWALSERGRYAISAQIIGAWTAFEALAGDLWEVALNLHPRKLASLVGKSKRIAQTAGRDKWSDDDDESEDGETSPDKQGDEKVVPLKRIHDITFGTFNLEQRMGTLLKKRFKFTSLHGIRKAYSSAFAERKDLIDKALSRKSLDAISLVRNLLVHKGGRADDAYLREAKGVPGTPELTAGQEIKLTGGVSHALINPAILAGVDLLKAVDEWVNK